MALFSIDGVEFNIPLVALKRESAVLDKYATRTEGGDLQREIIGVYYNYTLTFPGLNLDRAEYDRLWKKVTEPVEFHDFVVPSSDGTFSFRGYITTSGDELKRSHNGNKWSERGYAPIYARENFENCWMRYHALGENGVMDDLHEKFLDLPTEAE